MPTIVAAALLFILSSVALRAQTLQDRVNAAVPGEVIEVAAGVYPAPLRIPAGVIVAGAGAESCAIEAAGAGTGVVMGAEAVLMGLSVRNAQTGIVNADGAFIAILECDVTANRLQGIRLDHGSAFIAHSMISDTTAGVGILCREANPILLGNLIADNPTGVGLFGHHVATLTDNLFVKNGVAIRVLGQASYIGQGNSFDGNGQDVVNHPFSADDRVEALGAARARLRRGGALAAYRALIRQAYDQVVAEHPTVIYSPGAVPGVFGVLTLFPWAEFRVGASAPDTRIRAFEAFDILTADPLAAELLPVSVRPAVAVRGDAALLPELNRYALEMAYEHGPSLTRAADGSLFFSRETTFSNIRVLVPAGYMVESVAPAGGVTALAEGALVSITNCGLTRVNVVLRPVVE